ncbi:sporulation YhaL family protein [Geomicrobium sp. JSM 1781026]|uniref:sporulation YhaL family protein n=1 Tax=Geomicrobium sp. JSM 1781026 TaxID=3344580 RepID=UPI0035C01B18
MERRSKRMLITLAVLFVVLAIVQRFTADTAVTALPWWVFVLIFATIVSGYMWIKAVAENRKEQAEWIEQEGRVYIRRMENERRERMNQDV